MSRLEREIAFWSAALDRMRTLHEEQLLHLLRAECYVETDLMALESYAPKVVMYRFKVRDNLKTKLLQIDQERRRLRQTHEHDVESVHERLLGLLDKRAHLRTATSR